MNQSIVQQKPPKEANPLVSLHEQLQKRSDQLMAALPAHIPVERFKRVLMTAVQQNPKLATADRQTLWNSALRAAQDGLLPDGREGAMVIYNTKIKIDNRDVWVDAVQWMPMVAGIRKKVRNSGEIATWETEVVYSNDQFEFEKGDNPYIRHRPALSDRGKVIAAYSVATLKSGEKSREVMSVEEIEHVRKSSKSRDKGPWVDHYAEMCRKTVARRHSKVLPMSTDLDDLMRRDDALYDFEKAKGDQAPARPKLEDFAAAPVDIPTQKIEAAHEEAKAEQTETVIDATTGEVTEQPEISAADAYERGQADYDAGKSAKAVPPEWRTAGFENLAYAWQEGHKARAEEMAKVQR